MSFGSTENRRLIEIPMGHQVRLSDEAFGVFGMVAGEVGRMALGRDVSPEGPGREDVRRRTRVEASRRVTLTPNVRDFWKSYLLGKDGLIGLELLAATDAYREFLDHQIELMKLESGLRIIDCGSGTGALWRRLVDRKDVDTTPDVVELDFVKEALLRSRSDFVSNRSWRGFNLSSLCVDLDESVGGQGIPLLDGVFDVVYGSLLVSYLKEPGDFVKEAFRLLRPGGRIVISGLKQDADISRLCVEGIRQLRAGRAREVFGVRGDSVLSDSVRSFVSDAARVLDLEELGLFRFSAPEGLMDTMAAVGFVEVELSRGLGAPPQAFVISAVKQSASP
jgi:SAM-dependent methyltransferase